MSEPSPTVSSAPEPVDAVAAIWQLRALVCGLGAMVLVLSLAFNAFVWKQNRNITSLTSGRKQLLMQAQARLNETARVANELATYSNGKPELVAIFTRHGMELKERPTPSESAETKTD